VLRTLQTTEPIALEHIIDNLRSLLSHIDSLDIYTEHGLALFNLIEQPFNVAFDPFTISDGTLRLLALLTAFETMPESGLLCIEEPEHGLHPLLFGPLLDIMREYCPPRQIILTTHSPDLIDAACPAEVLIVERGATGATEVHHLEENSLTQWLQDFRLGELWRMRQIGGVPS